MHNHSHKTQSTNLDLVLREARKLHRYAQSEVLSKSLPVLRRVIATQAIQNISLPQLRRQKEFIKRKQVLHMLAIEAGFLCWAELKNAVEINPAKYLKLQANVSHLCGPNLWFSTYAEAQSYAQEHGGEALQSGKNGVVVLS